MMKSGNKNKISASLTDLSMKRLFFDTVLEPYSFTFFFFALLSLLIRSSAVTT